jgi:hypothetical protein
MRWVFDASSVCLDTNAACGVASGQAEKLQCARGALQLDCLYFRIFVGILLLTIGAPVMAV